MCAQRRVRKRGGGLERGAAVLQRQERRAGGGAEGLLQRARALAQVPEHREDSVPGRGSAPRREHLEKNCRSLRSHRMAHLVVVRLLEAVDHQGGTELGERPRVPALPAREAALRAGAEAPDEGRQPVQAEAAAWVATASGSRRGGLWWTTLNLFPHGF